MAQLGLIGGTGLTSVEGFVIKRREMVKTPYGAASGPILFGEIAGNEVAFLARHGHLHSIPPHRINYRANIWALHSVGIRQVVAVAAVGGIAPNCETGVLVIPDQLIDYTCDRVSTYYDGKPETVTHIDFTYPYTESLRQQLIGAAELAKVQHISSGVYGVTQGPRLETAAEIVRLQRDGCTIVGMTSMPEAGLARELELDYACCAVVVNRGAGLDPEPLDLGQISVNVTTGMAHARSVINQLVGSPV